MLTEKTFYRRNLPHWDMWSRPLFCTMTLKGSIPQGLMSVFENPKENLDGYQKLLRYRAMFQRMEEALATGDCGPTWFENPEVSKFFQDCLHHRDGKVFTLFCYCVMPNHVHFLYLPLKKEKGSTPEPIADSA